MAKKNFQLLLELKKIHNWMFLADFDVQHTNPLSILIIRTQFEIIP